MQRPTLVTVFGILNMVFGVLGVLGMVGTLVMFAFMESSDNPAIKAMKENANYAAWLKLNIPLGLLACAVLIVAGIGLLKLKNWARKLSIGYAVYAIVFGIVGIVVNYLFLIRPMLENAARQRGPEAFGSTVGAISGSVGGLFGLIYPVFLLVMMTRPNIVAAFRPVAPPPLPQ